MTRTQKVREIYRELRFSMPGEVPGSELLRCAAEIVELCDEDTDSSRFELRLGGIPFDCQALDVAFADGGWRVMQFEESRRQEANHEEANELNMHNGWVRWARGFGQ